VGLKKNKMKIAQFFSLALASLCVSNLGYAQMNKRLYRKDQIIVSTNQILEQSNPLSNSMHARVDKKEDLVENKNSNTKANLQKRKYSQSQKFISRNNISSVQPKYRRDKVKSN